MQLPSLSRSRNPITSRAGLGVAERRRNKRVAVESKALVDTGGSQHRGKLT